jgi:hypothetical protein
MSDQSRLLLSRRQVLKYGGLTAVAAGAAGLAPRLVGMLQPANARAADPVDLEWAGTDGWIHLPPDPPIGYYHPDDLAPTPADGAPPGLTTYIFGFRNVTGLTDDQVSQQKMKAQHSAPLLWLDQYNPASPKNFIIRLRNIGMQMRPDLFDAHTIHWHGFRNVIPFYDGEPTGSVAVPPGQEFTYVFRPRDPGTYMYHCHVEDVEHVQMGMTGLVFVRPLQNGNTTLYPSGKYAYNDGDGSTGYDREFAMFLSEVFTWSHWADSHIQLPEWSDYRADFSLLNGRVYPDTLAPNGPIDAGTSLHALSVQHDTTGDLVAPAGRPDLKYQPHSSVVTCQPGERVLLRFANLGYKEASMSLTGIRLRVVGKDATPMRGRDGTDTSYLESTVNFGAGESIDAIFTAPTFSGGSGSSGQGYDTYVLYNRTYTRSDNLARNAPADPAAGGGQRTEVRVYPSGVAPQQYPNDRGGV